MSNRLLIRTVAIIGCCSAISQAAINRSVKTRRHFGGAPISRVCLVSLDAQVSRIGMKGAEPLLPEGEEWGRKLRDMMTHAVAGSGWTLVGDLSTDNGAMDEQLRQPVLRVKQKYDMIAMQLNQKPGKVKNGRYTLGDEVALLPCSASADSLLFVRAVGVVETGGRKAFSLLIGGSAGIVMAQARYKLSIAFVDAKTGEVTAFTLINFLGGNVGNDPEKVLTERLVEEFDKMHPGAPKP